MFINWKVENLEMLELQKCLVPVPSEDLFANGNIRSPQVITGLIREALTCLEEYFAATDTDPARAAAVKTKLQEITDLNAELHVADLRRRTGERANGIADETCEDRPPNKFNCQRFTLPAVDVGGVQYGEETYWVPADTSEIGQLMRTLLTDMRTHRDPFGHIEIGTLKDLNKSIKNQEDEEEMGDESELQNMNSVDKKCFRVTQSNQKAYLSELIST
jgi:hypothetical protein